MAALVEGQQYGLSAQDKINCNKSLIFVKLTDSALRSIDEFVKSKVSICFNSVNQCKIVNFYLSLLKYVYTSLAVLIKINYLIA